MESAKTLALRSERSGGYSDGSAISIRLNGASQEHAIGRLGSGFDLSQLVSEYRALRASVLQLWRNSRPEPHDCDIDDLTLFNESIDQSLAKAVDSYTRRVDQTRDLYLGILSHDLRSPLNSITMSAALLPQLDRTNVESKQTAVQIALSAQVMGRMIGDLLDYTRTRLGAGMPVTAQPMNLAPLCRDVFDEFRTAHPSRLIRFESTGDANGDWDADRLRQALANLMGNAVQHGSPDAPIDLKLSAANPHSVTVVIQNGGPPIPPGEISKIFEPLVRGSAGGKPKRNRPGSIGLGLYIAREIAKSHGGDLTVTSSAQDGTAFEMRLPRHHLVVSGPPILDEDSFRRM
jgi:signal transduction histidine kinase